MRFAKFVFYGAGIYGLLALVPQYFLEAKNGRDFPPAITHPEYFYGFVGVGVAFQVVFLIIGRDPRRYRAMMIPSMIEKFSFVIAVYALFALDRVALAMVGAASIDLLLGILFAISFFRTREE
ncbi:MAG: hypothetical protein JSS81_24750 [Acidobacteria bacterium]|nr:hypothetical protein [Acidobacteriota bacterium]